MVTITDKRSQPQVNTPTDQIEQQEKAIISPASEIIYSSSDGEPLAETQQHVLAILTALAMLRRYLQEQPAVVFADQFLYFIEGNPKAITHLGK